MHREWFEPALARELGQVAAPEELWERVNGGRKKIFKKGVHRSVNAARVGACATLIAMLIGCCVEARCSDSVSGCWGDSRLGSGTWRRGCAAPRFGSFDGGAGGEWGGGD